MHLQEEKSHLNATLCHLGPGANPLNHLHYFSKGVMFHRAQVIRKELIHRSTLGIGNVMNQPEFATSFLRDNTEGRNHQIRQRWLGKWAQYPALPSFLINFISEHSLYNYYGL